MVCARLVPLTASSPRPASVRAARRVVAVADSSKIGRQGFKPIAALEDVDVLITDTAANPDRIAEIRAAGVDVILA